MVANSPKPRKMFEIKEKLLRPALTSHYECFFNPPEEVRKWLVNNKNFDYKTNQDLISLSCSEASLPGSSLMTNEIIDDFTGVTERHAYRRQYDDRSDFTFYVDHGTPNSNYNVLWFFEQWMSYIVNEQFTQGLETDNYSYRVNFPINYQSPAVYIHKFEKDFREQFLEYRFLNAYPISITSMPISYDSSQLLKCTVSFTYTRYVIKRKALNVRLDEPRQQTATGIPQNETRIQELYRNRAADYLTGLNEIYFPPGGREIPNVDNFFQPNR